jgi:hypothetical protein
MRRNRRGRPDRRAFGGSDCHADRVPDRDADSKSDCRTNDDSPDGHADRQPD